MRFSQRIGKTPIKTQIQFESMDNELRSALWNCFHTFFLDKFAGPSDTQRMLHKLDATKMRRHFCLGNFEGFFRALWNDYYKEPYDKLPDDFSAAVKILRGNFFASKWFEVYDFLEYITQVQSPADALRFKECCNAVLEREVAGYRFVDNQITPITDANELAGIEDALKGTSETTLSGVNSHLTAALVKLSSRKNPDYRNSIKESISAVEAIAQLILGNPKTELGQALKIIENKIELHPALKKGFLAIYEYTSDADGIRHAMIDESKCDFDDAKYMLVSCSAFINYLIMKAVKAGISFNGEA